MIQAQSGPSPTTSFAGAYWPRPNRYREATNFSCSEQALLLDEPKQSHTQLIGGIPHAAGRLAPSGALDVHSQEAARVSNHESEASNTHSPFTVSCIPQTTSSSCVHSRCPQRSPQMADASDSTSSGRRTIKRQAPNDAAEQQDITRRKRGRQADPQQSSNPSLLFSPSTLHENTIDLTGSDDEDQDFFMDWAREESPMRDLNEVDAPAASGSYDACFGLVRRPP